MTRLEKMQAVVDAARALIERYCVQAPQSALGPLSQVLSDALAALDADAEAGKTVTLAVWELNPAGEVRWVQAGSADDVADTDFERRLGTVTLPLVKERGA